MIVIVQNVGNESITIYERLTLLMENINFFMIFL